MDVGLHEGLQVGTALGASVGWADGPWLGPKEVLGTSVGGVDGARLGSGVGSALGLQDGLVGVQLGLIDGPDGAMESMLLGT